jgi:hypothetical protein
MKRGFFYGLGAFLVVGMLAGISELFKDRLISGGILIIICASLSLATIRKARQIAKELSRTRLVIGWLIGFFAIDAIAAIIYVGTLVIGSQ